MEFIEIHLNRKVDEGSKKRGSKNFQKINFVFSPKQLNRKVRVDKISVLNSMLLKCNQSNQF